MNMITVWLLVGIVSANGRAATPPEAHFATKESCEIVKRNIEEVASASSLRCVEAKVIK